jgi:hypothetical protein
MTTKILFLLFFFGYTTYSIGLIIDSKAEVENLNNKLERLISDTTKIATELRTLHIQNDNLLKENETLKNSFNRLKSSKEYYCNWCGRATSYPKKHECGGVHYDCSEKCKSDCKNSKCNYGGSTYTGTII